MSYQKDWLSPERSPQQLETTGVRRVNNVPLMIAMGVLTVFILLIAMVAMKRANAQSNAIDGVKPSVSSGPNTLSLANDVVGKRIAGIVPSATHPTLANPVVELPVAVVENPNVPPKPYSNDEVPDTELERIRQEKIQQFEKAVNANPSIAIDRQALMTPSNENQTQVRLGSSDSSVQSNGIQGGLQSNPSNKPMSQTLGGSEDERRWVLHSNVRTPKTPFVITAGGVIPGVMISGIRSDLPGQIIGQVSQNVYDTATGRYLLIPQGTKLFGLYSSEVSYGQDTLLVAWQRLTFPDGKTLDIGSMPGSDSAGFAGFRDRVNPHYARIFGSALLMSGIVAGITYSQNQNQPNNGAFYQPTAGNVLSQALGQQLGEVTSQMIMKNLNIAPTIEIGSGYPFNIIIVKDLVFKRPYRAFDY